MNDISAAGSRPVLNEVGILQEVHSSLTSIFPNIKMKEFSD